MIDLSVGIFNSIHVLLSLLTELFLFIIFGGFHNKEEMEIL